MLGDDLAKAPKYAPVISWPHFFVYQRPSEATANVSPTDEG
jgi:hypothetical protein